MRTPLNCAVEGALCILAYELLLEAPEKGDERLIMDRLHIEPCEHHVIQGFAECITSVLWVDLLLDLEDMSPELIVTLPDGAH